LHYQDLADRNPDRFIYSWELVVTHNELGRFHLENTHQWEAAISSFEMARETLKKMVRKHGNLVSRMVQIQGSLAEVDHNLSGAQQISDPIRYFAGPGRAIETEKYRICDKLSLVQQLSHNLRKVYAHSCLSMFDLQKEDAEKPDLELILKAERLWVEIDREAPTSDEARGMLVVARRWLADELDARGRRDEASRWRGQSLTTARGNPDLLYELATFFALNARLVGKWPTKLTPEQLGTRRRRYEEEAFAMLREAVADGFRDARRLRNDPEFAPLRSAPAFRAIIPDLEFPTDPFTPH
jgi:hypothetical protein